MLFWGASKCCNGLEIADFRMSTEKKEEIMKRRIDGLVKSPILPFLA